MTEFVRVYGSRHGDYAVRIKSGMKPKDLPEWFHPVFRRFDGGYPDMVFERGAFWNVQWAHEHPLDAVWKEVARQKIENGFVFACSDGGARAHPSNVQTPGVSCVEAMP